MKCIESPSLSVSSHWGGIFDMANELFMVKPAILAKLGVCYSSSCSIDKVWVCGVSFGWTLCSIHALL